MDDWCPVLLPVRGLVVESGLQQVLRESEIIVTFPDPYTGGAGQGASQPPRDQRNNQPPPGQGYNQPPPGQGYGQPQPGQNYGQPQPGQNYGQPQPGQGYGQPGEAYGQTPPTPGFTSAPAVAPGYGQYPVAAVPQGMYVDQASGLLLPDGTELASVGRRIGAYFLAIPLAVVTLGIGYVIWGLIAWGNGQTPALQVLGMRVWRPETNRVAGFGHMALREIVGRIADGILSLITEITSFVMFVSSKDRKSLHDHIAGTVVLYDPNKTLAS
jgi:uncharacterized RDD family membrane protein YckC